MTIHQRLFTSYGTGSLIAVESADFDGTNDYMTRGAGLTGAANSKTGIFSGWIRLDGGDASTLSILHGTDSVGGSTIRFLVSRAVNNLLYVQATNAAASNILIIHTSNTYTSSATWLHMLTAWNLATASVAIYINDVSDLSGVSTILNDTSQYVLSDWSIGALASGTSKLNGCLAEVYFAPGQFLDFSIVDNRRKFISSAGKPVWLGTDGSVPTGTAPLVYQHLATAEAVANFATNRATGGNFTITGTLTAGSTSPSD